MEKILLEDIKTISIPGISEATGAYLCEGCVVCMNRQSHSSGVQLSLKGDKTASIPTEWSMAYTDQLDRSWQDQEVATEHGAVCLSVLLSLRLTDYTILRRARKKTGVDYFLCNKEDVLFQDSALLEVSGIYNGQDKVDARAKQKLKQTNQSNSTGLPTYVSVVEFSEPSVTFVKKK